MHEKALLLGVQRLPEGNAKATTLVDGLPKTSVRRVMCNHGPLFRLRTLIAAKLFSFLWFGTYRPRIIIADNTLQHDAASSTYHLDVWYCWDDEELEIRKPAAPSGTQRSTDPAHSLSE
jgi:hypothetical protein